MTPSQFKKDMTEITKGGGRRDPEMEHVHADELLCKALREAGYEDGVDIYEKLDKWYA